MIDVFHEELLTLGQAAKALPQAASFCSVYRWAVRGRSGNKLETIVVGNRRYTTRAALQRFFEQVTAAENSAKPDPSARTRQESASRIRRTSSPIKR